jgi:DNA-binding FadR family transcriptional regulator
MPSAKSRRTLPVEQTVRYRVVYKALCEYARQYGGNTPTERRLAILLVKQMSYSTVRAHLSRLEQDGLIKRANGEIMIVGAEWTPPPH